MSFEETLATEKRKIEDKIKVFFDQYSQPGTFYNQFLYQFYSDLAKYLLQGGKRLRPVSLVVMYKGLGGNNEDIYNLAISVELLHNASLVHDDIIDHDLVRRGHPSFHAFYSDWFSKNLRQYSEQEDFGLAMGILGGNLLVDLGQQAIIQTGFDQNEKLKALTYYLMAYKELIDGVTAESYLQSLPLEKVSEDDYLAMIRGKTAALFEKSILIGAFLADRQEKYKDELSKFATLLGQAFQIRDDILGVFGDPTKTGKSVEGDIREGKKTLLAIYGVKNAEFVKLYGKQDISKDEIARVRQILRESGALEKTKEKALDLATSASEILKDIELNETAYNFFNELIKFVQERVI